MTCEFTFTESRSNDPKDRTPHTSSPEFQNHTIDQQDLLNHTVHGSSASSCTQGKKWMLNKETCVVI